MVKIVYMMSKKKGFTLLEVLMVIAIIAILAAMTIPTYQKNTTKAKLSNVAKVLDSLMHDVLKDFGMTGYSPTSLHGVSGTGNGSYGAYSIPHISTYLYYLNGQSWNNDGAMIALSVPADVGKGIPGYVAATNGGDGAYNSIAMAFYDDNGTIMLYCGRWDSNNPLYIPVEYLPSGCDTDNIQTIIMTN